MQWSAVVWYVNEGSSEYNTNVFLVMQGQYKISIEKETKYT